MKTKNRILICMIASILLLTGCGSFDELNTDSTRLTDVNPGTLLNPVLYGMATYNWNRYDDFAFPLLQSKVLTSSSTGVGWYYLSDAAGDGTWTTYYKWLNNIKKMEEESVALNLPNYHAVAITLRSWIYQLLVDSFGDIPMSEASSGDEGVYTPKFDTQKEVYTALINDLDSANNIFNTASGLKYNTGGELLYSTDATLTSGVSTGILKWKKFCNSLRMRVLLRVLNVDGFDAQTKLVEMINNPTKYPVFASNDDAALLYVSGVSPLLAPLTRSSDFTSYTYLSDFFVSNLQSWNDPRLAIFATKATNNGVKSYVGMPSGYSVVPSGSYSQPNVSLAIAPMKLTLMNYAEVELIKAELAQRGIITESAQTHYQNGVSAAITQWGGVVPSTYFSNTSVAYDGSLSRIMLQKFYALFFCDCQAWYELNRTGYPVLPRGSGIPTGNSMPYRYKYPAVMQRTNLKNYQAAKANMGGDDFSIKLIWQK
ncbi:MAG: hypothetical protein H6Q17_350 [Bacteroidetes bacterium]|jgi:hypothetical protein|nr:hypothetical protein [Bacteroidota bacterium]